MFFRVSIDQLDLYVIVLIPEGAEQFG